jgi:hypothetical protein
MRLRSPRTLFLLASIPLVSCGEKRDVATEPRRPDASSAAHDASLSVDASLQVPATSEQLLAFRRAIQRWSSTQSNPPRNVDEMVAGVEVALVGVLGGPRTGRKAFVPPDGFDSYVSLELRDVQVFKGAPPEPSKNANLELHWPSNVGIDELIDATPVGARVIVLADWVKGALEEAQRLETATGIPAVSSLHPNLLEAPPYGLLIEGADGQVHAPILEEGPLVQSGGEALVNFRAALEIIRVSAER